MKLSEVLAELKDKNVTVDDLVDDTSGMSMKDMRAKMGELTKGIEAIEGLKQQIAERDGRLGQLGQENDSYRRTLEASRATLDGRAAHQIDRSFQNDSLYQPLMPYLNYLEQTLVTAAQALAEQHNAYQADRKFVMEYLNKVEADRMKRAYKDFDEDKIREHARKKNMNRSWDDVYKDWKSDQYPNELEAARKEEREKVMREIESKGKEPPVTEGSGHPPAPEVPEPKEDKGQWGDKWRGLVDEIKGLGL